MKIGDYVRFYDRDWTEIGQIVDEVEDSHLKVVKCKDDYYDLDNFIKSSPNIIELFEEHDLIVIEYYSLRYKERVTRLFEVDYKDKEFMTLKNAHCDFMLRNNEFNDEDKKLKPIIKSIVTKEQFEAIKYEIK